MTEFVSRKYGHEGFEIIIKTDSADHYKAAEYFARKLIDHAKPRTNADLIREMSDEDLAKLLFEVGLPSGFCKGSPECIALLGTEDGIPDEMCLQCALKWLHQPAEV